MRNLLLLSSLIFLQARAQNIFTVNNTPGIQANYKTLQGAVDSVPSGSILLVQPSAITYVSASIRKPIVIYGPGYFLGQNPNPNNQAKNIEAIIGFIDFGSGSNGSKIYGLDFEDPVNGNGHRIGIDSTSDITIGRCMFTYSVCCCQGCHSFMFNIQNSSSITIEQSFMDLRSSLLVPIKSTGITFRNNIITSPPSENWNIVDNSYVGDPYSYTMDGNTMYADFYSFYMTGGSFINNIMIKSGTGSFYPSGSMSYADHNVSNMSIFPPGTTNITNADPNNIFVGTSNPGISSQDGVWQLKPGSVAAGYVGGKDAGAFGGDNPYVLSGIPAIPNIYFAQILQPGTSNGGLKVHLRIKANN